MAFQIKRDIVFQIFLCSFLCISMTIQGTVTDIVCLQSIKKSLEDPNDYLQSWNFNNNTEGFICKFIGVECWHPDENRVLNLKLPSLGLKGQLPWRGLRNCSSMTGLDLSWNELSGPIPSDISEILTYITMIDLSDNKLTGEIPTALANCTYLNVLKLDNNMLSGQIPLQLGSLTRLKTISFANNHLSGPVPVFNSSVDIDFANNSGLCGGYPLGPCPKGPGNDKFHPSFKGGLIIGYVLSFTCSVIITCMFYSNSCVPCLQLNKKKRKKNNHQNRVKHLCKYICSITSRRRSRMAVNQLHQLLHSQLIEKESIEISVLLERLSSTIWFEELSDATEGFAMDNAIGVGKMGIMYQGRLPNGQFLAVKRLFDSHLFKRQFLLETMILGKYRHINIVPLVGFSIEGKERLLAYADMSNGRLSKWLNPLATEVMRLRWSERAKIALGIARGLTWLHHSCDLAVVHFNICSQCILLDEHFEPKISNFGEAKFMNLNNIEDDLLGKIFEVSDGKKDVYDFGSVLFELITGRTYNELSLSSSITDMCGNPSNFYNVIDKSLTRDGFENELCALIKIACECVQSLPDQRPTMLEVYNNMSNVKKGRRHGSAGDSQSHTLERSEIAYAVAMDEIDKL